MDVAKILTDEIERVRNESQDQIARLHEQYRCEVQKLRDELSTQRQMTHQAAASHQVQQALAQITQERDLYLGQLMVIREKVAQHQTFSNKKRPSPKR